ncbi:hypothetical protein JK386_02485 [Nocardioides sp. zg-536]|uniref:Uncharacterized protein n=1 Tax=Nocardioides faecalis TaxID=2803858 RepID=A0A939BUD6_9ACTN|nr:hypothetical protein [Nocardioides faecalis]MBM9458756.1 hypothetical protein [Nocardioides faecalis]QVI60174.1 hypothetical protein KG111_07745 [Nocardioides faecalis]
MDPLYIVELSVAVADGSNLEPADVFDRLTRHAADWLERGVEGVSVDFAKSDRVELPARRGAYEFTRAVRWSVTEAGGLRALQGVMSQPIEDGGGARFICEFTIFQDVGRAALRVELGRESVDGLMSPVTVDAVRRPGFLGAALRDPDLQFTYQGQIVDGRYEWINSPQAALVPEVIAVEQRLPILLVDGGDPAAKTLGHYAASQLSGLAQVLLVDRRAQSEINEYLDSIGAPLQHNCARLIWPVLNTRHPEFWDLDRSERIVSILMKMVAGVSVAARGTNRWRVLAASKERQVREQAFEAAIAQAAAAGDKSAEVEALRTELRSLRDENEQWVEEVDRLTVTAETVPSLHNQIAYWKAEAQRAFEAAGSAAGANWSEAPSLDADDLGALSKFLEGASAGAIVFTAAAQRSWRKCGYPHIEAMGDALVRLAQAAADWRNSGCDTGMTMKAWFKTKFELNYSPEDEPLRKNKSLRDKFEYDGVEYSREPHLKLDDHVKPNEVGRVYFALDTEGQRFIVDHVGLKLYGV